MEVQINTKIDRRTMAARLMSVIQNVMMGNEVTLVIGPDIPMNELDEVFQKLSEFAALSWSMVKPDDEDKGVWQDDE